MMVPPAAVLPRSNGALAIMPRYQEWSEDSAVEQQYDILPHWHVGMALSGLLTTGVIDILYKPSIATLNGHFAEQTACRRLATLNVCLEIWVLGSLELGDLDAWIPWRPGRLEPWIESGKYMHSHES